MIDLSKEAEEYATINKTYSEQSELDFIAGANSKYVQAKIIQAQIDALTKLDTELQSKVESLKAMANKLTGVDIPEEFRFNMKASGVMLAKEEIRRDLKDLNEQLKQLENEYNIRNIN
jgi:seryl-tRNA synthetase